MILHGKFDRNHDLPSVTYSSVPNKRMIEMTVNFEQLWSMYNKRAGVTVFQSNQCAGV